LRERPNGSGRSGLFDAFVSLKGPDLRQSFGTDLSQPRIATKCDLL